ncbi:MAG: molybdenum cofactor biosynthesis protein MoaE [Paracoccaceae bacterium]
MAVRVQSGDFDPGAELSSFVQEAASAGAVVTFTGLVRDIAGGLQYLEIEHYPAMTQSALESLEATALTKWKLQSCLIIHRYGRLNLGETIMMVATAAPHRAAAFEAADFLMDNLKSRAPFWKKEVSKNSETWVQSKDTDKAALRRWKFK